MRAGSALVVGLLVASLAVVSLTVHAAPATDKTDGKSWPGEILFRQACAGCHEGGSPKAPPPYLLKSMSPLTILRIIEHGVMKDMAAGLTREQRRQIVEYLTQTDLSTYHGPPPTKMCDGAHREFDLTRPPPLVGWGYDNRRFVPTAVGGLSAADLPRLKLKWAFAYPDATQARSQPVVAMGAIFVGSHTGTVYALDIETGCARWTTSAIGEVRTAVLVETWRDGAKPDHSPRAFFGDQLGYVYVYAIDALTGKELWRVKADSHSAATITGTAVPWANTLYVPVSSLETGSAENPNYACCTFRGSVVALDVATGRKKWQAYTVQQSLAPVGKTREGIDIFAPSGAPVWGAPTVDQIVRPARYSGRPTLLRSSCR